MLKRLKFKCWKCERDYSLTLELKGKPTLNVACPGQWQTYEYNISPLAAQWLYKQGTPPPGLELLRIAAK